MVRVATAIAVFGAMITVAAGPAIAGPIADGTVTSAHLFSPSIDVSSSPATYSVLNGGTFQVAAGGAFASSAGGTGTLNGTISFSQSIGQKLSEVLLNVFVFSDGAGGTFNFSAESVTTRTFSNTPGVTTSGSLYLLGTTSNNALGFDPTPSSLTISFNSTGDSSFSSSATLAVPPTPLQLPEPASMALLGAALVGCGLARRKHHDC